jgi:hypothetical protein
VRTFAHVDGAVTADSFAAALKAGHAYVTYGPIIYPTILFGTTLTLAPGAPFTLGFDVGSVAGVKQVQLISDGIARDIRDLTAAPVQAHVDFSLRAQRAGWYALLVEDRAGRKAYTDPIWVVLDGPGAQP